ncbi:MAG: hypothetical protein WC348_03355 [Patescibacteria group bacterium]|jgi:type III secretion system FlhB-like substrate exporter
MIGKKGMEGGSMPYEVPEEERGEGAEQYIRETVRFPRVEIVGESKGSYEVKLGEQVYKIAKSEKSYFALNSGGSAGGGIGLSLRLELRQVLLPETGIYQDEQAPDDFKEVIMFHEIREIEYVEAGLEDAHDRAVNDETLYVLKYISPDKQLEYFKFAETLRKTAKEERERPKRKIEKKLTNNLFPAVQISNIKKIIDSTREEGMDIDLSFIFKEALKKLLSTGAMTGFKRLIGFMSDEGIDFTLTGPELFSVCQEGLEGSLSGGAADDAEKIIKFAEEKGVTLDLSRPEIAAACQDGLQSGFPYSRRIANWAKRKNINVDLSAPEVASSLQESLEYRFGPYSFSLPTAEEIISWAKKVGVTINIDSALQKGLEKLLPHLTWRDHYSQIEELIVLAKKINQPFDFGRPEIISGYLDILERAMSSGDVESVKILIDWAKGKGINLEITSPKFIAACQKGLEYELSFGGVGRVKEIIDWAGKNALPLVFDKPEMDTIFQNGLESVLRHGRTDIKIEEYIAFVEKKGAVLDFSKPEITVAGQKGLEEILRWYDWSSPEEKGEHIKHAEELIRWTEKRGIKLDLTKPEIVEKIKQK